MKKIVVLLVLLLHFHLLASTIPQSLTLWVLLADASLVVAFLVSWVWVDKRFPPSPRLWVETLEVSLFAGGGLSLMTSCGFRGLGFPWMLSYSVGATFILLAWLGFYGFCKLLQYYAERSRPF